MQNNVDFYLYAFLLSYSILVFWFVSILLFKKNVYEMHTRWFKISLNDFEKTQYFLIGFYKLLILSMFLVPYLSLKFIN
jgi:hypothetical protein